MSAIKQTVRFILLLSVATYSINSQAEVLKTGVYSGNFENIRISLFIDKVENGKVIGRSLYLHNERPLTGTISQTKKGTWQVVLNEPATKTGDGQFNMTFNKNDAHLLKGSWQVFPKNDTKEGISKKQFTLKKSQCDFKKQSGYYPKLSTKIVQNDELFLSPDELDYMRNEIYARHGYSFSSRKWAIEFANLDWYVPCYTNVENTLNKVEKENINRIKAMHKYMLKHPTEYGR